MSGQEPEQRSPAAGACVVIVLVGGAFAAVFAASPALGVLAVWMVGAIALVRAATRRISVRDTANPAPPAPSEGADGEFMQVIESARQDGSEVTEFPSGTVVISTPDAANPSRTHVRVVHPVRQEITPD